MDFSNEVAGQIPIPKLTHKNKSLVDNIIALVDKILAIKSSLRDLTQASRGNLSCHTEAISCHTEVLAEVSQSKTKNRDISVSAKPQYDKVASGDISLRATHFTQYDKDITDLESKIDNLVFKLYNLDSAEIKIVQGK